MLMDLLSKTAFLSRARIARSNPSDAALKITTRSVIISSEPSKHRSRGFRSTISLVP